jgi:hypothetical protein
MKEIGKNQKRKRERKRENKKKAVGKLFGPVPETAHGLLT